MSDPINPDHYKQHPSGIEAIEITAHFDFCIGNAFKYMFRAEYAGNQIQDLKKAVWYLQHKIKLLEQQYDKDTQEVADFLTTHQREAMSKAADINLEGRE